MARMLDIVCSRWSKFGHIRKENLQGVIWFKREVNQWRRYSKELRDLFHETKLSVYTRKKRVLQASHVQRMDKLKISRRQVGTKVEGRRRLGRPRTKRGRGSEKGPQVYGNQTVASAALDIVE